LCTAAHAINNGQLSLQLEWDADCRLTKTRKLSLTQMCSKQIASGADIEGLGWTELDFAFCKIPPVDLPLCQELDMDTLSGTVCNARPCTIYKDTDIKEPNPYDVYGFAGGTKMRYEDHSAIVSDVKFFGTERRVCYPLSYVGEQGDFYAFKLPGSYPGDEYFKGCSGAPIVDMDEHVVALVCWGCPKNSTIYGFPVNRYKAVLEVSASGLLDSIMGLITPNG
jgi:hypothetical protein